MVALGGLLFANPAWVPPFHWRKWRIMVILGGLLFADLARVPPLYWRKWRIMVTLGECCFRHAAVKQVPHELPRCRTLLAISALPTGYFKHLSVFIGEFMQCLTSSAYLGQTATLHQTVRCLWLLARLIQRPDFALLSASSVIPNDVNLTILSFKPWFRFPLCHAPRCLMMQTWQYSRFRHRFRFLFTGSAILSRPSPQESPQRRRRRRTFGPPAHTARVCLCPIPV